MTEKPDVLFTEQQIAQRVAELGAEMASAYSGGDLSVVGLMKSCLLFMADLIRRVPLPSTCHFLNSSALRETTAGSTRTDIVYSTDVPYEGRHILLLAPVVDTGITLTFLLDHIREHRPASVRVCAHVDKPGERKVEVALDWTAFTVEGTTAEDRFLVGYGLDHAELYRGLPYIGTIPRPATFGPGSATR